jgi:plastocyanin
LAGLLRKTTGALLAVTALAVWAPLADAEVRTYTVRSKPVAIDPYQVKYTIKAAREARAPGVDGFVTGMYARLVDAAGRPIPVSRVMLHHVLFKNLGSYEGERHDRVCPELDGERFYGTGEEDQPLKLPGGYGYPVAAGDRWAMSWMLMNHSPHLQKAYVEYTVTVDTSPDLKAVHPYWVGAVPCPLVRDPIYNVPGGGRQGSTHLRSATWTVPESGRLVAANAHLHGGATGLSLSQPRCGDRALLHSRPRYGLPGHPYYRVRPVLHEPGPFSTSWAFTPTGIPVAQGEKLRLTAAYDGELPHTRVMGIMHVYLAPDAPPSEACAALPGDLVEEQSNAPGRERPPRVKVPLTTLDQRGRAVTIERPRGRRARRGRSAAVLVRGFRFGPQNLSVPLGARVSWRFPGGVLHNVTLANGPRGFASRNLRRGRRYSKRFRVPGSYRLYCSLHPIAMSQSIVVRRQRDSARP